MVLILRGPLITNDNATLPFDLHRHQFSVLPAFGMTISKVQGQTLSFAVISLIKPVFTHVQLYVALSRVHDSSNLRIKLPFEVSAPKSTANDVYTEVLNNFTSLFSFIYPLDIQY